MKNLYALVLVLFIASCDKEDEIIVQQDPAVVNITQDTAFGEPITFSTPQRFVHYNRVDTFTLIKGGVPPYYIKDKNRSQGAIGSPTITAFISNDTLFYESYGGIYLTTITVSDNRDYNTSQFSYISTGEELTLSSATVSAVASDGNNTYSYDFTSPAVFYYGKNDSLSFRSLNNDNLIFYIKDMKRGNLTPDFVYFFDDESGYPPFRFTAFQLDSTKQSSINVAYGILNYPKSLEFEFFLESQFEPKRYITLRSNSKIYL